MHYFHVKNELTINNISLLVRIDINNFKFNTSVFSVEFFNIGLYEIQVKRVIFICLKLIYLDLSQKYFNIFLTQI